MVVCCAVISFNDGTCCSQNLFEDANMKVGHITYYGNIS